MFLAGKLRHDGEGVVRVLWAAQPSLDFEAVWCSLCQLSGHSASAFICYYTAAPDLSSGSARKRAQAEISTALPYEHYAVDVPATNRKATQARPPRQKKRRRRAEAAQPAEAAVL